MDTLPLSEDRGKRHLYHRDDTLMAALLKPQP